MIESSSYYSVYLKIIVFDTILSLGLMRLHFVSEYKLHEHFLEFMNGQTY